MDDNNFEKDLERIIEDEIARIARYNGGDDFIKKQDEYFLSAGAAASGEEEAVAVSANVVKEEINGNQNTYESGEVFELIRKALNRKAVEADFFEYLCETGKYNGNYKDMIMQNNNKHCKMLKNELKNSYDYNFLDLESENFKDLSLSNLIERKMVTNEMFQRVYHMVKKTELEKMFFEVIIDEERCIYLLSLFDELSGK